LLHGADASRVLDGFVTAREIPVWGVSLLIEHVQANQYRLLHACRRNCVPVVHMVLQRADNAERAVFLQQGLEQAMRHFQPGVVFYLVGQGADMHADDHRALRTLGSERSFGDAVQLLTSLRRTGALQADRIDQRTVNELIVSCPCKSLLRALRLIGAPEPSTTALNEALFAGASKGWLHRVQEALQFGATDLDSALIGAANVRPLECLPIVRLLLHNGANVHATNDLALRTVCTAAIHGQSSLDLLEVLLNHGADVHALEDACLVEACTRNRMHLVRTLLRYGADPLAQNGCLLKNTSKCHTAVRAVLLEYVQGRPSPGHGCDATVSAINTLDRERPLDGLQQASAAL